jgi:hypothetical protein
MKQQTLLESMVLFCILGGGLFTFWYARGNMSLQLTIGALMTVAYVLWGIMRHQSAKSLHRKIVIEYVLVGVIALVLLATLAI